MQSKPKRKRRNFDRRLFTILLIVFVQMVGASMVLPILPLYAKRSFDMNPSIITLLGMVFFAAQFVAGPFLGRLSDTYGRIPVLIISQIGTTISFIMLGVASSVTGLFAARILDGITGGNIIVAQAYITDITPPERRTESLGYIFAVFGLGFVFGPAIGGILSAAFDINVAFYIAAIAAGLTTLLTQFTLDETLSPEQRTANRDKGTTDFRPRAIVRNVPLMMILFIAFVGQFGLGLLQGTFALFGEDVLFAGYDADTISLGIGFMLAFIGLSQFLTQALLLRPLLQRFGEARLVIGGSLLRIFSFVGYAFARSPLPGFPLGGMFALGTGVMMPSLQGLATKTVEDELRGGVLGLYQSSISLSLIASTAISGALFEIAPQVPYIVGACVFLLVIPPTIALMRWASTRETRVQSQST